MYGEGKLELVPAYLHLAEANLGLLQYRQAEEYLTLANWALLKAGSASNALRSQLRRNFGKLYASQARGSDPETPPRAAAIARPRRPRAHLNTADQVRPSARHTADLPRPSTWQGRHEEALRQLADDVYYSSLMVGPEHIDTSGGYFQLGNVFYAMNRIEAALAMYDKAPPRYTPRYTPRYDE